MNPLAVVKHHAFEALSALLLAAVFIFGGSNQAGDIPILSLRLIAIVVLVWGVWRLASMPPSGRRLVAILLLIATWTLPLLQLIPLPPDVWTAFTPRADLAAELQALGFAPVWRPLSLTPDETYETFLALLIPSALLLAVLSLDHSARYRLLMVIVAMGVLSVILGAFQVTGGRSRGAYLYDETNFGSAVGFFSNRNHLASFMAICLLMVTALLTWRRQQTALLYAAAGSVFVILIVGLAISGSRAGLILLVLALIGSAYWIWTKQPSSAQGRTRNYWLLGLVVATGLVVTSAGAWAALGRMQAEVGEELRFSIWQESLDLASTYLPLGAGGGSFPTVYEGIEKTETLQAGYVNHTHNDYIELLVDYGVLGPLLLLAYAIAIFAAWRWRPDLDGARVDRLSGPVLMAVLLLAVHSIADYPIRMPALGTLCAFFVAILLVPTSEAPQRESVRVRVPRPTPNRR